MKVHVPRQVSLRVTLGVTLTSILLVSAVLYYVWAATPSSTFWLAPGIYPGAPSYTVWKEGSTYFAKDANGEITDSGTNASQLVNDAIDALPSGGEIFFRVGEYVLTAPIVLASNIHLRGENWNTIIKSSDGINAIETDGASIVTDAAVSNLAIEGTASSLTGLHLDTTQRAKIDHVKVEGHGLYGIYLEDSYIDEFNHVEVNGHLDSTPVGSVGVLINASNVNYFVNSVFVNLQTAAVKLIGNAQGNVFVNSDFEANYDVGLWIYYGCDNTIRDCWFEAIPERTLTSHIQIEYTDNVMSNARNAIVNNKFQVDSYSTDYGIYLARTACLTHIAFNQFYEFKLADIYISDGNAVGTTITLNTFQFINITDGGTDTQLFNNWNGTTWVA